MRHKNDLSPKDGRIILLEYIEEHPLVIENIGMGTKIRNYYQKNDPNENPLLEFEDGEQFLLDKGESPFFGNIQPGI